MDDRGRLRAVGSALVPYGLILGGRIFNNVRRGKEWVSTFFNLMVEGGTSGGVSCVKCSEAIQAEFAFCPFCATEQVRPVASIELTDSVAREVRQTVTGDAGASITARGSAVGSVHQQVDGATGSHPSIDQLRELASINISDGVVKEIHQVVNVHVHAPESVDMLQSLAGAGRLRAESVFVACGRRIKLYHVGGGNRPTEPGREYLLPDSLGSARSVRLVADEGRLRVVAGARGGVAIFDAQTAEAQVYPLPETTRLGANATTVIGEHIYATHSNFGLMRWPLSGGDAESVCPDLLKSAKTIRAVQSDADDRLLLCADSSVCLISPDEPGRPPAVFECGTEEELVGAVECDGVIFGAGIDGRVFRWDADCSGRPKAVIAELARKTYTLSLVQTAQGPHLAIGSKAGGLTLVGVRAPHPVTQYRCPNGAKIRWAKAAADMLIASDDRCAKLFVWRPDLPARPQFEIPVAQTGREQIMDFCILSK
jgi:hypothetical protein